MQLLDYGFSEGVFFFTMEYCQGGTVEDWMKKTGGKLNLDVAIPIILQILDGLDYSHNLQLSDVKLSDGSVKTVKGLIHRDLKPSNIFLQKVDDRVIAKVGDYGLAITRSLVESK